MTLRSPSVAALGVLAAAAVMCAPAHAALVWATDDGTVRLARDDGTAPVTLARHGAGVSMSPDGRFVSWTKAIRGNTRTVLASVATGAAHELPARMFAFGSVWTADDRFVVDVSASLGAHPGTITAGGSSPRLFAGVHSGLTFGGSPSPDGASIV